MRSCMSCKLGYHDECMAPVSLKANDEQLLACCCLDSWEQERAVKKAGGNPVGRPPSDAEDITDNLSAGRHRAQRLAPIFPGMLCEWAGLRYAGGGIVPIVGCNNNRIADVKRNADLPEGIDKRGELHHGPDKNTLNNGPNNLHRVCASCHKHWHALNDRYYEGERPSADEQWLPVGGEVYPHDAFTKASAEELARSEEWWAIRTEQRPEYPFPTGRESGTVNHP